MFVETTPGGTVWQDKFAETTYRSQPDVRAPNGSVFLANAECFAFGRELIVWLVLMSEGPFATDRTRRWRQSQLRDFNRKEIDTIEQFGNQVLCVGGDSSSPSFAYTFGLFDTCGLPEIIEVGLPHKTASALLEEAADRLRNGVKLSQGRHAGLFLADVECEFRTVDPKWIRRLMLGATWFYEGAEFPALQAVYPDLENRFPEDTNFDLNFAQPLLQPEKSFGQIEEDFWKAYEKL